MGGGYSISGGTAADQRRLQQEIAAGGGDFNAIQQAAATERQRFYTPPAPGPDLTDEAVRAASLRGLGTLGRGRKSTFLTGPASQTLLGG